MSEYSIDAIKNLVLSKDAILRGLANLGIEYDENRHKALFDSVIDVFVPGQSYSDNKYALNSKRTGNITYIQPAFRIMKTVKEPNQASKKKIIILHLIQCGTCKEKYLVSNVPEYACRKCSNTVTKPKFWFINPLHREIFIDMAINMHARCYNPDNPRYNISVSKNIQVADEWRAYHKIGLTKEEQEKNMRNFYNYCILNGWRPGLEIDRTNNDLGYIPGNIRFVSPRNNLNNRSTTKIISFKGMEKSKAGWARFFDMSATSFDNFINKYGSIEKAMSMNIDFEQKVLIALDNFYKYDIDKDREFCNIEKQRTKRNPLGSGMMYRGILTSKSNWARAIGTISPATLDDALRRHNNSIQELIDYSNSHKMTHDYQKLFDEAVDSGRINEVMGTNKSTSFLYTIGGLSAGSKSWADMFRDDMNFNTLSIIFARSNGDTESLFGNGGRLKPLFIRVLEQHPDRIFENQDKIYYNGVPLAQSDFDVKEYIAKYYHWLDTHKWELPPSHSEELVQKATTTSLIEFGNQVWVAFKKITIEDRLNPNNIIKSSDGREYIINA